MIASWVSTGVSVVVCTLAMRGLWSMYTITEFPSENKNTEIFTVMSRAYPSVWEYLCSVVERAWLANWVANLR